MSDSDKPHEGENGAPTGTRTEEPITLPEGMDEASMEQLEAQLKALEEDQVKLAAQFDEANETMTLDSHLAVIEEQFRRGFDDRISTTSGRSARPSSFISRLDADQDLDVMKINSVFREVSRALGDEWRSVFTDLTSGLPKDQVEEELGKLERVQPIIRGYRALNSWRDLAGESFNIRDLISALRKNKMDDIADSALTIIEGGSGDPATAGKTSKPVSRRKSDISSRSKTGILDNRRMLLLAKKIGGDWEPLGKALGLPEEELTDIKEGPDAATYQGAFKVLWGWRQTQPEIEHESSVEALKAALNKVNKGTLAEQLCTL